VVNIIKTFWISLLARGEITPNIQPKSEISIFNSKKEGLV